MKPSSSSSKKSGGNQRVAEMAEAVEVLRLNLLAESIDAERPSSPSSLPNSAVEPEDDCSLSILEQASTSNINSLNKADSSEFVTLNCQGRRLDFEVDCGACRSVIFTDTYQKHFSESKLVPTALEFVSVSGQRITPKGTVGIRVSASSSTRVGSYSR